MHVHEPSPARLRRIAEELEEELGELAALLGDDALRDLVLTELDYAMRPHVHERRVPSFGAIVAPSTDPAGWESATGLRITRRLTDGLPRADARLFADGLATWTIPTATGGELLVLDRPAGSERDLVVLASATGGIVVQRHPASVVRLVGPLGVARWDGMLWHHEPPVDAWIEELAHVCDPSGGHVLGQLLSFAVHDLGARGVGALLVHRTDVAGPAPFELRMAAPPPLRIGEPTDLAPLRHVLAQVDGAAVFDAEGVLTHLGVRLVPTAEAEDTVAGYRGMRHTAAKRYSYDDPTATVIAVSEDGPVTVLRGGELVGRTSPT